MEETPNDWSTADAVALRTFIAANPRFLPALSGRRPKIEGTTMEARAVTGSDVNGFLLAVDEIKAMQKDPADQHNENPGFITGSK